MKAENWPFTQIDPPLFSRMPDRLALSYCVFPQIFMMICPSPTNGNLEFHWWNSLIDLGIRVLLVGLADRLR